MANIPQGVIFIWTGTNASIPAGWERVTSLDGKFPKVAASGVNPNVTGGSATHTHTSPAHSHSIANHTHTITITGIIGNEGSNAGDDTGLTTDHTGHAPFTSGAVSGGGLSSVSSTYSAYSNNPPYYEVIFITPSSPTSGVPNLAVTMYEDNDFTVSNAGKFGGWYECDGTNTTPDLRNKYLRGAGTSADAGGTGGSTSNTHNLEHTHTVTLHTHIASTSGAANRFDQRSTTGSGYVAHNHTHQVGLLAPASDPISSATVTLNPTETVEPAYKKILHLQNRSSTTYTPLGVIGMWLGTLANIPTNYEIVSSMYDKYIKGANLYTEIGDTGGSNTHTHAGQTHTHTSSGTHTHTANGLEHVSATNRTGSDNSVTPATAVHTQPTVTNETTVYNNATTTADSSSNEPEYRTVALIKLVKKVGGGAFLYNLI